LKILLIRPPYTRLRKTGQAPFFPLGLGYLASVLKKNNHSVGIYNGEICKDKGEIPRIDKKNIFYSRSEAQKNYIESLNDPNHPVWKEISGYIKDFNPDVVGISLLSVEVGSGYKISRIVKDFNPEIKIIWGGIHPTFLPEDCLNFNEVDYVIRGEGEDAIIELLKSISGVTNKELSSIKGLVYKDREGLFINESGGFINNLDSLPLPDRNSLINYQKGQNDVMGSIITSRGCPYRCAFCSSQEFWHRKVRNRSAENVLQEIKTVIEDFGTRFFTFWDDSFSLNKSVIKEMCESLLLQNIRISWRTATRADLLDRETLLLMKRSGCFQLELGVESGSKKMAKKIKKDLDLKAVSKSIKLINNVGIASGAFFMAGFPEETVEDLDETFDYMRKINATEIVLNVFDPMPGSEIFNDMIMTGQLKEPIDWLNFPLWPDTHYAKVISPEVFNSKVNQIADWIFTHNGKLSNRIKHLKPKFISLIRSAPLLLIKKILNFLS